MSLTRRRFLTISAAFAAGPARALAPARWRGMALGAEAEITLHGPGAEEALEAALAKIRACEARFSLYDPASDLSRLNRTGKLDASLPFRALMQLADRVHEATGGAFDPSVQPLWRALASGGDVAAARARIGWEKIVRDGSRIALGPGQALTFNGIAQGVATDAVAELLAARGFGQALINIGEFRALGGPWRLGLSDPEHGPLGTRTLNTGAVATSSPAALRLGQETHILDPRGAGGVLWSTVSVEAESAALADALSTAGCMMDADALHRAATALGGVRRITLVTHAGDLRSLSV